MLKFEKGTSAKGVLSLKCTYITTAMLNSCHNSFLASYGSPELLQTGKRFSPMVQGLNHEFQAIKQPGKKPFSLALCIYLRIYVLYKDPCQQLHKTRRRNYGNRRTVEE